MPNRVRLKLTREEWKKIYKQELKRVERELLELAKEIVARQSSRRSK